MCNQSYLFAHGRQVASQQEDGIQNDHSFHQHGPQLYMGWGYGGIYTTNVLLLQSYASGTSLSAPTDAWNVFASLVLDGQQLATRGPNWDASVCGRLMTYFPAVDEVREHMTHHTKRDYSCDEISTTEK